MGCHLGFYGKTKLTTAKHSLAAAIRTIRKARGLSQEAFSDVSSRTYMSSLERDLKSPTLHKLTALCEVMEEIGRASCRERVCSVRVDLGGRRIIKKTRKTKI